MNDSRSHVVVWPRWKKTLVSLLVALHLSAVFLAPFWFASGRSSPALAGVMPTFQRYINALYLNHGYQFFAPNPGPAHLVEYRLKFDDGRPDETARFPDAQRHWPRLLYHRHFMLSESLYTYSSFPPPPADAPPFLHQIHAERIAQRDRLAASLAKHLRESYHADDVTLHRIEHRLLLPDEWRSPQDIRAAETYIDLDNLDQNGGAP